MNKTTLYSYCIPVDDGAAPNPYWGICTLAICKPVIRRTAKPGDWIVATGSTTYSLQNKVVYAMQVTDVKTFNEYNTYCEKSLQNKIPDLTSKDIRIRAGDCIYYNKDGKLKQRNGAHNKANIPVDKRGKNVLLSEHFYYFGKEAVKLPNDLLSIVKQGQGHRSRSNADFARDFIDWINSDSKTTPYRNDVKSEPQLLKEVFAKNNFNNCSTCRKEEGNEDEACVPIC